jgi:hypothetical protein
MMDFILNTTIKLILIAATAGLIMGAEFCFSIAFNPLFCAMGGV